MPKQKLSLIRKLGSDPATQYRFNLCALWLWVFSMPATMIIFWPHTLADAGQLAILEVSLWANVATHFSGISASLAARHSSNIVRHSGLEAATQEPEQNHYSATKTSETAQILCEIAPFDA